MARKVFISSAMSYDETLSEIAEAEPLAALLWPWFLTYFDDWGRAKTSPREIKNSVFQANELITIDFITRAIALYDGKLLEVYEVEGKSYMSVAADKWFKHQTHIRREKRENDGSKYPPPTARDDAQVRADARDHAESRANLTDCIPSPSPSPSPSKDIKDNVDADASTAPEKFIKPSLEEVIAYCAERNNGVDPVHWYDHYTSKDWKVGKVAMKNWKAAVRTWERNNINGFPKGPKEVVARHKSLHELIDSI